LLSPAAAILERRNGGDKWQAHTKRAVARIDFVRSRWSLESIERNPQSSTPQPTSGDKKTLATAIGNEGQRCFNRNTPHENGGRELKTSGRWQAAEAKFLGGAFASVI
jgi:hypothetical protein